MNLTENAKRVLRARYCRDGETPEDVLVRSAEKVGKVSNKEKEYIEAITNLDFLPNSPCLHNAGYSNMLKACFVLAIEDSMSSIFKALSNSGIILKEGGGVGYNFSKLREEGSLVSSGGRSSGVISFLNVFNTVVDAVNQGGFRKGACMGILDYDHPEIMNFISLKLNNDKMANFNLSVMVDDIFMQGILDSSTLPLHSRVGGGVVGNMKAQDIFDILCYSVWIGGDPGMLFVDRINRDNPYKEKLIACNPCGEQFLNPLESCCLGSINLSQCVTEENEINVEKFKRLVRLGAQFLLDVNKLSEFSIGECYTQQYKYNRIGLGIMGFADMLIQMGIMYDSEEALMIINLLGSILRDESKKVAPMSASTTSIAPTGTLSIIADCSPSIEPIFDASYTRHLNEDIGTIEENRTGDCIRTAHEIEPIWHLRVQAEWQKYIDNGVSKTVNLPHDAMIQDVKDIYERAWDLGCKGITVYRDGSKTKQVYYKGKCDGETCNL